MSRTHSLTTCAMRIVLIRLGMYIGHINSIVNAYNPHPILLEHPIIFITFLGSSRDE